MFVIRRRRLEVGWAHDGRSICIARVACDKYRSIDVMSPGAKIKGFLTNLLSEYDEEDVVLEAMLCRNSSLLNREQMVLMSKATLAGVATMIEIAGEHINYGYGDSISRDCRGWIV